MSLPTPSEYQEAIQTPRFAFSIPSLQMSHPELDQLGLPKIATGNFACVFKLIGHNETVAVRCFLRKVSGQQRRYHMLNQYLKGLSLPMLVDFEYIPKGIQVHGQWLPIVKMQWVEGETLDNFIKNHRHEPEVIAFLAAKWRDLIKDLQNANVAHGDLQHGNVIVDNTGRIRLVDYDAMFIPPFYGETSPELGHPNYQHPNRSPQNYDRSIDNFSALVIYLSLLGIAAEPSLWDSFHTGDNLILTKDDFLNPKQSPCIRRLKESPQREVRLLATYLEDFCFMSPSQIPNLERILQNIQTSKEKQLLAAGSKPVSASPTNVQTYIPPISVRPKVQRRQKPFIVIAVVTLAILMVVFGVTIWVGQRKPIIALISPPSLVPDSPFKWEWSKVFPTLGRGWGTAVRQTKDGGYIVTGNIYKRSIFKKKKSIFVLKVDDQGNEKFRKVFENGTSNSIELTKNGYLICGTRGHPCDTRLIKIDLNGNLQFDRVFTHDVCAPCYAVKPTPWAYEGGYILVAGDWVIKVNSAGTKVWERCFFRYGFLVLLYAGPDKYIFRNVLNSHLIELSPKGEILNTTPLPQGLHPLKVLPNGSPRVLVCGQVDEDIKIVGLNIYYGTVLWEKVLGRLNGMGYPVSFRQLQDGGYLVEVTFPDKIWLIKTDALGNKQHDVVILRNEKFTINSIELTSDGGYILV